MRGAALALGLLGLLGCGARASPPRPVWADPLVVTIGVVQTRGSSLVVGVQLRAADGGVVQVGGVEASARIDGVGLGPLRLDESRVVTGDGATVELIWPLSGDVVDGSSATVRGTVHLASGGYALFSADRFVEVP